MEISTSLTLLRNVGAQQNNFASRYFESQKKEKTYGYRGIGGGRQAKACKHQSGATTLPGDVKSNRSDGKLVANNDGNSHDLDIHDPGMMRLLSASRIPIQHA